MSTKRSSLQKLALKGGAWATGSQIFRLLCQMASISVLARLLVPEDFGVVGFLISFTVVLALLRDMGLSPAIIRSATIKNEELNTLFLVSLGIGVALFILVSLFGWSLSAFVEEPKIAAISPYYGLIFFIDALSVIPLALMRRNMKFREIAIRDSVSNLLGILFGISSAFAGAGYWALVIMAATSSLSASIMTWASAGWLPKKTFTSFAEIRHLLVYGGAFTVGQLANVISENLDKILIGRLFGMKELGYYTRAHVLIQTPTTALLGPVQTVLFPIMSKARHESVNYHQAILFWGKSIPIMFALGAALAAASSETIILLVLGSEWSVSADVFKWLSLLLFARPLGSMVYLLMMAEGNMKIFSAWVWSNMVVTVAAIILGANWGIVGVAAALGLSGVIICVPLALWFLSKSIASLPYSTFIRAYFFSALFGIAWYYVLLAALEVLENWNFTPVIKFGVISLISLGFLTMIFLIYRTFKSTNKTIFPSHHA